MRHLKDSYFYPNNRIRYLISEKGGITDSINHNFGRIRIDLYNSLNTEKILTFHHEFSLSQFVRIKITTTTIYFYKKVCMKINLIHNIFK